MKIITSKKQRFKMAKRFMRKCLGQHNIYTIIARSPNVRRPRNSGGKGTEL